MTDQHCFISYSAADGLDFATQLFNELAKCDTEGILKDVRNAAEGKE